MPIPDAVYLLAKCTVLWIWGVMMAGITIRVVVGSFLSLLYPNELED